MNLDVLEGKRADFNKDFEGKHSLANRNKKGQFATPPQLANHIVNFVLKNYGPDLDGISFLEPCIGTGAFFSALLQNTPLKNIKKSVGVELDFELFELTRDLWGDVLIEILNFDFTEPETFLALKRSFNLIITNPPYVRHQHLSERQKERLQNYVYRELGFKVNGLAGLYVYFILIAHKFLSEKGLGVWLIPSEFFDVNYGEVLRKYFTQKVELLFVHKFDPKDLQFCDALVSSSLIIFRKSLPGKNHSVKFSFGSSLDKPKRVKFLDLGEFENSSKWSSLISEKNEQIEKENMGFILGDLFKIQRGIATGGNEVFILPFEKAQDLGISKEFLQPILPSPRYIREKVIERDQDGFPKIERKMALLNCSFNEDVLKDKCPKLYEYFKSFENTEVTERYLIKKRHPWYKQEKRMPSPILCTYMGRNEGQNPFRFFLNYSDAIAPNVYLMLYPKETLLKAMKRNPSLLGKIFVFLSTIKFEHFEKEGRVYGGGLHKIEPNELTKIPIIDFSKEISDLYSIKPQQMQFKFESPKKKFLFKAR